MTFCHSDFSERLSVKTGVKNLQGMKRKEDKMQIRKVHKKCSMLLWQSRSKTKNIQIMNF